VRAFAIAFRIEIFSSVFPVVGVSARPLAGRALRGSWE
jgi:hypothetical protein